MVTDQVPKFITQERCKMTKFNNLLHACGLSTKGAAMLLDVRYDTIKNWKYGRCNVPDGVMHDLELYAQSAKNIFKAS